MSESEEFFETVIKTDQITKLVDVDKSSYRFVRITIDRDSFDIHLFMEDFDRSTKIAFALKNIDKSEQSRAVVNEEVPALAMEELVSTLIVGYEKWFANTKKPNHDQNISFEMQSSSKFDPVLEMFNCNEFSLETVIGIDKIDELLRKSRYPFVRITIKINQTGIQIFLENFEGTKKTAFALKPTDKSEELREQIDENVLAMTKKELSAQLTKSYKEWIIKQKEDEERETQIIEAPQERPIEIVERHEIPSEVVREEELRFEVSEQVNVEEEFVPPSMAELPASSQKQSFEEMNRKQKKLTENMREKGKVQGEIVQNNVIAPTLPKLCANIPSKTPQTVKKRKQPGPSPNIIYRETVTPPTFLNQLNFGKETVSLSTNSFPAYPFAMVIKTPVEKTHIFEKQSLAGPAPMKRRLPEMCDGGQNELTKKMRENVQGKAQEEKQQCVIAKFKESQAKQMAGDEPNNGNIYSVGAYLPNPQMAKQKEIENGQVNEIEQPGPSPKQLSAGGEFNSYMDFMVENYIKVHAMTKTEKQKMVQRMKKGKRMDVSDQLGVATHPTNKMQVSPSIEITEKDIEREKEKMDERERNKKFEQPDPNNRKEDENRVRSETMTDEQPGTSQDKEKIKEVSDQLGVATHPTNEIQVSPSIEITEKDIEQEKEKEDEEEQHKRCEQPGSKNQEEADASRQLSDRSETMTDDEPGTSQDKQNSLIVLQHMKDAEEQLAREGADSSQNPMKKKTSTIKKRGRPRKLTKENVNFLEDHGHNYFTQ